MAAEKEGAWGNVGQEKGLQIWKIEKSDVTDWPKEKYGEFYGGDSYIILNTMEDDNGKKSYDVFFWLGSDTSQDEAGTAAQKTVELDDYLGYLPVQYREVQGNESTAFRKLFPKMTILEVDQKFRETTPKNFQPRLLHVCGVKQHVQVYQVKLDAKNLNDSDSFVLDCGLSLFQFNGSKSSEWEKMKADEIIEGLKSARNGKVGSTLIINGFEEGGNPQTEQFWLYFGGKPDSIADEAPLKEIPDYTLSLHHISDAKGVMETNEVCSGKLDKSKLDSDDVFLLDGGKMIFVWIGKGANRAERREAMKYAQQYLKNQGRKNDVWTVRVLEGRESLEFWDCFAGNAVTGKLH